MSDAVREALPEPPGQPAPCPLPVAVRSLAPLAVAGAVVAAIQLLVPSLGGPYATKVLLDIGINVVLAVSLNLVNGFTGQFSIGHAGFMAVGAYVSVAVTYYGGLALWGDVGLHAGLAGQALFAASLVAGGLVAAVAGAVVGLPSLRLRGDYLAIVTLGFGEIIRVLLQATPGVLETAAEAAAVPAARRMFHVGGPLGFTHAQFYTNLAWVWGVAAATLLLSYRLRESSHGRAYLSVRENEVAAEAVGVDCTRYKVQAFVLAAFLAGVGGALFGHELGAAARPEEFNFMRSFEFVIMVVLGGMGSISGAALAAIVLTLLTETLRSFAEYRMVAYAALLVAVMILRPQGLFGTRELWSLARRRR